MEYIRCELQDILEWESGSNEGIITKGSCRDLVSHLLYITDPAGFMAAIYGRSLRSPDLFMERRVKDGVRELRFKDSRDTTITAITVGDTPFWLHGYEFVNDDNEVVKWIFSSPSQVDSIPDEMYRPLDEIVFRQSSKSITRHQRFP